MTAAVQPHGCCFDPKNEAHLVNTFIIVRSGYTQHMGSAKSGCAYLAGVLDYCFGGHRPSGRRVRVELMAWSDCPGHMAEHVYRLGTKMTPPTVIDISYSWGCGYGFVQLARELQSRGIDVAHAVLSDPVHHGLAFWRAVIPRTLFRKVYVRVPSNVSEITAFRQNRSKPAGHELRCESRYTKVNGPYDLPYRHVEMDNAPEFHDAALLAASRYAS